MNATTITTCDFGSQHGNRKYKVLVTNPTIPSCWLNPLYEECDVETIEENTREMILEKVSGVHAILWSSDVKLDKEIIDAAGCNLKVVATMSFDHDHDVDTEELKRRRIPFGTVSEGVNDSVSTVAVMLALCASRRLHEGRLSIERGEWKSNVDQDYMIGRETQSATVGIIGLGRIGLMIAKKFQGFDVRKILYTGNSEKTVGIEMGAVFVDLDTLARKSDFVIVSCSLNDDTRGMCNECFFSKMKRTAVFVNISLGGIVVQEDLIQALKKKKIFAAGLDVMEPEPLPTDSELLKLPNLVLAPHIGTATLRTRRRMAELTCANILRGLNGQKLLYSGQ